MVQNQTQGPLAAAILALPASWNWHGLIINYPIEGEIYKYWRSIQH